MGYSSAKDRIQRDEFEDVLGVLVGKSPWQSFLINNLKEARKNWSKPVFQVLNSKDYADVLKNLHTGEASTVPGVTDKGKGQIFMQDKFGQNAGYAMLGHSLHEAVHLVSHPPGGSSKKMSSAKPILDVGLFEGLVEFMTEEILTAQGITLADDDNRGHIKRVPVVRHLCKTLKQQTNIEPLNFFGCLLFTSKMSITTVTNTMADIFTMNGWVEIRRLTTANQPDAAIAAIDRRFAEQTQKKKSSA
jgi:hypothetical protein